MGGELGMHRISQMKLQISLLKSQQGINKVNCSLHTHPSPRALTNKHIFLP